MKTAPRGHGIGTTLLPVLVALSEALALWILQAQIIANNHASRALHLKCGLQKFGVRERLGHIKDTWHDVVLKECRSKITGGPDLPSRRCGT